MDVPLIANPLISGLKKNYHYSGCGFVTDFNVGGSTRISVNCFEARGRNNWRKLTNVSGSGKSQNPNFLVVKFADYRLVDSQIKKICRLVVGKLTKKVCGLPISRLAN
jgi:hypothetical protein